MRLRDNLGHLTYCLNIHHSESWADLRAALEGPLRKVRQTVCPDAPFAVGLRVSARGLAELRAPEARAELKSILEENRYIPLTMNGFPYGPFHGTPVKEAVYQPDWRTRERLAYTTGLADLMAGIAAPGSRVSLSTVPGCFQSEASKATLPMMVANYIEATAHCARLAEKTGVTVALAIEPEPFCFLSTIYETVAFFKDRLHAPDAVARFAALAGIAPRDALGRLRDHLGLCYDVCHAAVEFEEPEASITALREAGIPIHKLQLSAALRATVNPAVRNALSAYAEPTYLHQVQSRKDGGPIRSEPDLPVALARGSAADGEEWRIHFHVPVFLSDLGLFASTQDFLAQILALHRRDPISPHLEVETYTFDVLPPDLRRVSLEDAVSRELQWVLKELQG